MAKHALPSAEELRQLLDYNPETGLFTWLHRTQTSNRGRSEKSLKRFNTQCAGKPAFNFSNAHGYLFGYVFSVGILAHRAAWAFHAGEWPNGYIDHINGDKHDNRIVNLRVVSNSENQRNRILGAQNKSGHLGVSRSKCRKKWVAKICVNKRSKVLGTFETFDEAVSARKAAEREHGFHPNNGRRENPESCRVITKYATGPWDVVSHSEKGFVVEANESGAYENEIDALGAAIANIKAIGGGHEQQISILRNRMYKRRQIAMRPA